MNAIGIILTSQANDHRQLAASPFHLLSLSPGRLRIGETGNRRNGDRIALSTPRGETRGSDAMRFALRAMQHEG